VAAVRLDQRDEALRELLGQLALANLTALTIASFVGYRLTRAALQPVERYRARAEEITGGATGVRLEVPAETDDEITRLGHTLNAMLTAQEHAAAQQRQFIDDASHELRTPLTVLAAEVELALRRTRSADEYEQTLRRISIDVAELAELADDLLTLGAQGASTAEARPVPVAEVLAVAADRARATLPDGSRRRICTDAPEGLEVLADPALLRRAVGNLVDNAVRYGDGAITLRAAEVTGAGSVATMLTVHDDGPGIPAWLQPEVFERFARGDSSRSRRGGSTGLGLAIVNAVVRAHGGTIVVRSVPGDTNFFVTLPRDSQSTHRSGQSGT
jgi:signal transduction histidine kinase